MLMPSIFGENLFDDLMKGFDFPTVSQPVLSRNVNNLMRTDIRENEKGFTLDIDLPGYSKDNVQAELKEGYLTITANNARNSEEKDPNGRYIRRERYSGSCSRSFYVGEDITEEDIKARFENGILQVFVPKKEAKPQIEEKKVINIE